MALSMKQLRKNRSIVLGRINYLAIHGLSDASTMEECKGIFSEMVRDFKVYDGITELLLKAIDNATAADYEDEIKDYNKKC